MPSWPTWGRDTSSLPPLQALCLGFWFSHPSNPDSQTPTWIQGPPWTSEEQDGRSLSHCLQQPSGSHQQVLRHTLSLYAGGGGRQHMPTLPSSSPGAARSYMPHGRAWHTTSQASVREGGGNCQRCALCTSWARHMLPNTPNMFSLSTPTGSATTTYLPHCTVARRGPSATHSQCGPEGICELQRDRKSS